jgi:hypothetical protein
MPEKEELLLKPVTRAALENFCRMKGIEGDLDACVEELIYRVISLEVTAAQEKKSWLAPTGPAEARMKISCKVGTADRLRKLYGVLCPNEPFRSWDWFLNKLGAVAVVGLENKPGEIEELFKYWL